MQVLQCDACGRTYRGEDPSYRVVLDAPAHVAKIWDVCSRTCLGKLSEQPEPELKKIGSTAVSFL